MTKLEKNTLELLERLSKDPNIKQVSINWEHQYHADCGDVNLPIITITKH